MTEKLEEKTMEDLEKFLEERGEELLDEEKERVLATYAVRRKAYNEFVDWLAARNARFSKYGLAIDTVKREWHICVESDVAKVEWMGWHHIDDFVGLLESLKPGLAFDLGGLVQ